MSAAKYARLAVVVGVSLWSSSQGGTAQADTSTTCKVSGTAVMPANVTIYDKAENGTAIARFTGAESKIVASDFFSGSGQRVKVKTGTGIGSVRVEGWIDASKLPLYAGKDIAVSANHIWIAKHQNVKAVSTSGGKLKIKKTPRSPFAQSFTASTACSNLTLRGGTPPGWTPPGHSRAYVAKRDVELYDGTGADKSSVASLTPDSSSNGILFFSRESRDGYVRIEHRSEMLIDAWAKKSALEALPEGETMDQAAGSTLVRGSPTLKLGSTATVVKTTKEVVLRASAGDSGDVIGAVESDTEVYVLDIVAGWASVLPKSLNVAPPASDGQFWARAKDIGATP
jgi:hypothetical protein